MDNNFTELIGKWLRAEDAERDYTVGALYLLKLSGNQILYRNLVVRRDMRSLEYHLQKYYDFRVRHLTHDQVEAMAREVEHIARVNKLTEEAPVAVACTDVPPARCNPQPQPSATASSTDSHPGRGRRADHDSLPADIQQLYVDNLGILHRMREVHLRLRTLSLDNAPCPDSERYPFLKELIALDKRMRSNWECYDHYKISE